MKSLCLAAMIVLGPRALEAQTVKIDFDKQADFSKYKTFAWSESQEPFVKKSFADLAGIMATGQAPPSDDEVDQILEEERQRKFR